MVPDTDAEDVELGLDCETSAPLEELVGTGPATVKIVTVEMIVTVSPEAIPLLIAVGMYVVNDVDEGIADGCAEEVLTDPVA